MEDAHIHLLSLPNDKDTCFFGVFDGHGGLYACDIVIFITSQHVTTSIFKMSCQEAGCSFVQFNCSQFPVLRYILYVLY